MATTIHTCDGMQFPCDKPATHEVPGTYPGVKLYYCDTCYAELMTNDAEDVPAECDDDGPDDDEADAMWESQQGTYNGKVPARVEYIPLPDLRAHARRLYGALFDLYELATTDGEHPDRDAILDGARLVLREGRP